MIRCPSCQGLNDDGAVICSQCNQRLTSPRTGSDEIDFRREQPAQREILRLPDPEPEEAKPESPVEPIEAEPDEAAILEDRTSGSDDMTAGGTDSVATGKEAPDTSSYGEAARKMLLDNLADDMATIGVIGSYNVGKTFFINQLISIAKDKGYTHTPLELHPGREVASETRVGTSAKEEKEKAQKRAAKIRKHLPITVTVWVHKFERDKQPFRIIDMPGEFFLAALDDPAALRAKGNPRIAMIYPALASSDALILIVPAHHAFGSAERDKLDAERAVHLLGNIRLITNFLEDVERDRGSSEAAVTEVLGLSPEAFQREAAKRSGGKTRKPITVLFSQADKCFDVADNRNPMGKSGRLPEHDPFLCAARDLPGLVNHLREGFDDFRVDFLTAAEGQKGPYLKAKTPSIGVWRPIHTLLDRIAMRGDRTTPSRIARFLRKAFLMDMLDDCERTSGWAIDIRAAADPEFGSALNG